MICFAGATAVYPLVNPEQGLAEGSTNVKLLAVTVEAEELNVAEVPLRLKPCEAISP
jgi:hypothetical protein